jgi:hypothetical protein
MERMLLYVLRGAWVFVAFIAVGLLPTQAAAQTDDGSGDGSDSEECVGGTVRTAWHFANVVSYPEHDDGSNSLDFVHMGYSHNHVSTGEEQTNPHASVRANEHGYEHVAAGEQVHQACDDGPGGDPFEN